MWVTSAFTLPHLPPRYARFIALRVLHPDAPQPLVPPADVALMWHAHMGLSGDYAAMCLGMPVAAGPAAGAGPGTGAGAGLGRSPTSSSDGASATSDHQVRDGLKASVSGRWSVRGRKCGCPPCLGAVRWVRYRIPVSPLSEGA